MVNSIQLSGVQYTYPGSDHPALVLDEMTIQEGQICWLSGLNGAGKTTLCRLLAGLIPHFFRGQLSGGIQVHGQDTTQLALADVSGLVGFIMDDPFDQLTRATYTVRGEIAFGLQNIGLPPDEIHERIEETMGQLGIAALAERLPTSLSGGEQQRVAIASIFARRPNVLVMDEATSQLDPQGCEDIFDLVTRFKEMGKTILMVESKPDNISQVADRLLVLQDGHLIANGPVKEVLGSGVYEQAGLSLPSYPSLARGLQAKAVAVEKLPVTLEEARVMVERLRHASH